MRLSVFSGTGSIKNHVVLALAMIILGSQINSLMAQKYTEVQLSWLGGNVPGISTGVSWGVPFAEGKVSPESSFVIKNEDGDAIPVQSWPMAYWPDGSLKWAGCSSVLGPADGSEFQLSLAGNKRRAKKGQSIEVSESENTIVVNTGSIACEIPRKGNRIIGALKSGERFVSLGGKLVCILQDGPEPEFGPQPAKEKYTSRIDSVKVEQSGPIRAVVKIEGKHAAETGSAAFIPFIVRLYFYAGQQQIRMVHTLIYDGEQDRDFIKGLGIVFDIPMKEEDHNRHIRFSGEKGGLWDEPVKPLYGSFPLMKDGINLYAEQLKGTRIENRESFSERWQFMIDNWTSWNDFRLIQNNAEGFMVQKRTNDQSAWIESGAGGRSNGLVFAGDVSGGLAVCVKDFWQSYPSALEVRNAGTDRAEIRAWLWSPYGPAMDMRHYDTLAWGHTLAATYEDVQPGFSTPHGIGRTSEILLFATEQVPGYETLNHIAEIGNQTPLLTASPGYLHSVPALGVWSLPDRSTRGKQWVENQLDNAFKYYQLEVEQRNWYGFWDYGDIMHGYDPTRHVWKYDIGGYAWDNTELMPNMWLWYSYLRTGREDIFRMAEAMTRHTGEVDVYHLGRFEGLGSRHNVRHWGCGAKEVRIAQAALGRFYYYLTTDERTGDLMHASVEASNRAIGETDPVRLIMEKSEYPTHARMGPDWLALVGNWMTEWERTGNTLYRDKIKTGIDCFSAMPHGLYSAEGAAFGYDPETHKLYRLEEDGIGFLHLSVLMGGPEVAYELTELLDDNEWDRLWLQFCRLYGAPVEQIEAELGVAVELGHQQPWYARLPAYYSKKTGESAYGQRAWEQFLNQGTKRGNTDFNLEKFDGIESLEPVIEVKGVSTNNTAQWCLNAIQLLELVGDQLPEDHPSFSQEEQ